MAHARHRRTRAGRDATAQLRGAAHPNPPPQSATRGGRPAREPPPHRAGTDGPRRAHSVSDSTRPWGQAPGWSRAAIFHPRRCARRPCVSLSARPGAVGRTRAGGRRNSEQPPASRTPPAVSATGATRGTTPAAVRFAGRWRPEPLSRHQAGTPPTDRPEAAQTSRESTPAVLQGSTTAAQTWRPGSRRPGSRPGADLAAGVDDRLRAFSSRSAIWIVVLFEHTTCHGGGTGRISGAPREPNGRNRPINVVGALGRAKT